MFVVNLKQNKMKYTVKQFEKHGTEILAYHNGKKIEVEGLPKEWVIATRPLFHPEHKYRIKKEPFYTNEIGEAFEIGDGCFYYDFNSMQVKVYEVYRSSTRSALNKNRDETTIFKTIKGALESAIKMYS